MEGFTPISRQRLPKAILVYRVDSTGRRNTVLFGADYHRI
jgi:hypothetical protein